MIGLLKSTSIVYLISVNDILGAAINSAAVNFRYLEAYIAVAIVYWAMCVCVEKLFYVMEKRYKICSRRHDMIEIKGLHKAFGQNQVLKGVDITVNKGDVVVVIGPSGSGKTTMLRCINFLERADAGTITVGDITVDAAKAKKKEIHEIRLRTAMVFQNYNLFANKTALGNVMEGLTQARGVSKEKAKQIALDALEKVGLKDKADFFPFQLSADSSKEWVLPERLC